MDNTSHLSTGGNLLDEDIVVPDVDYFRGGDMGLCYWYHPERKRDASFTKEYLGPGAADSLEGRGAQTSGSARETAKQLNL
jgi:hypothetical protein